MIYLTLINGSAYDANDSEITKLEAHDTVQDKNGIYIPFHAIDNVSTERDPISQNTPSDANCAVSFVP